MKLKLHIASLLTLGVLSGFVVAIILVLLYYTDQFSWGWVIGGTIGFNLFLWLVGPYISNFIYKLVYKIEFFTYDQISDQPSAQFMKKVCDKHNIKVPVIGIIKDQNPTAFTYGSASFNARLVLTEGIFHFLDEGEVEAVVAHELGHIINKDFIVMTIAATLLQILYEIYAMLIRRRRRSSGGNDKGGGVLAIIGLVSYFFYWIGTYLVLYLSRTREYYADEFSAKETGDPNMLSSALIKVAYGIATSPDTKKTAHLLNNTRAQGVFDSRQAQGVGMVYENAKADQSLLEKALLFDIVNPWAWILQLKSTHPLTGKRIRRLCTLTNDPAFDFERIENTEVDKDRLWGNFWKDFAVNYLYGFIVLATIGILAFEMYMKLPVLHQFITVGAAALALLIAGVFKTRYKYSAEEFESTTVIECMADIYASPVRGRPVDLDGKAIGRGHAGFVIGEDMIFQDKTGFIYLNYESGIPFIGNLLFGWKKVEKLLNKPAHAKGWFMRGVTHHIELHRFKTEEETIKSRVRLWNLLGNIVKTILYGGALFWLVVASSNYINILN